MDTVTRKALAALLSDLDAREAHARGLFESATSQEGRLHRVGEWNAYNCAKTLTREALASIESAPAA